MVEGKRMSEHEQAARVALCWRCADGEELVEWHHRAWRGQTHEWQTSGHCQYPGLDGEGAAWCNADADDVERVARAIADAVTEERRRCEKVVGLSAGMNHAQQLIRAGTTELSIAAEIAAEIKRNR
jgi:hypothetical protein